MNTASSPLAHLSAEQHSALFESARRRATQLRREAICQLEKTVADELRALRRRLVQALTARRPQEHPACPR
jgi:hypothetical protein